MGKGRVKASRDIFKANHYCLAGQTIRNLVIKKTPTIWPPAQTTFDGRQNKLPHRIRWLIRLRRTLPTEALGSHVLFDPDPALAALQKFLALHGFASCG